MSCVVIAEDDADLLALYSRALTRCGHSVIPCRDGRSAFIEVRDRRPDLLLTDVDMPPGMTGLELVTAVQSEPVTADIPIIVATGGSADLATANVPGVVGLLRKPLSPRELVGHVEAALANGATQPG
ncbi:hypothetical protein GCM10009835_53140 [Planosporangium flavigriseum]|uniref:Response regulatory domain-containing protein n=1 Tax=Planosporangium flavigriseum TaxID=373681 RepID=A0A8J3PND3_9ACTN|nr:response regulator [Planosporangium flavigriseum]GIG76486.1 hypothetical protein Pfl04_48900 [Planosporangium flavigriseum]